MKDYRTNKKTISKPTKAAKRRRSVSQPVYAVVSEPKRRLRSLRFYFPLLAVSLTPLFIPMKMTPAISAKDVTVVALGDSITWGYPDGNSWTTTVTKETGLNIINKGISGNKLGDMFARLDHDVLSIAPQICLVMGGTNDVFRGLSVDEMMENLEGILAELEKRNIMPVIGLPVPLGWTNSENKLRALRQRILQMPYIIVDFAADFRRPREEFKKLVPDGIHPEGEGKRLMAERLKKELPRILRAYEAYHK
ncbi:MAG: GDSL-type esterase/lipase family protein [Spirochaetota bacterium]